MGAGHMPHRCGDVGATALTAAAMAACIAVEFRRKPKDIECKEIPEEDGFRMPAMPLIPLLGILMNMLLLSELPLKALWRTLGVTVVHTLT